MRFVEPMVELASMPQVDARVIRHYLTQVDEEYGVNLTRGEAGAVYWFDQRHFGKHWLQATDLVEIAGRLCYRSWAPDLNPNVSKIREDQTVYVQNILKSRHGSVLEHAHFSFILHNVSRVFTHELVRHRHGNFSQESMRFVRLTDIPFWVPDWAKEDGELMAKIRQHLGFDQHFQEWMARHFKLDDEGVPFHEKKAKTSFMRRFAPNGVTTDVVWTSNLRDLRHICEVRTSPGAEEEIRLIFQRIYKIMLATVPAFFSDFKVGDDGIELTTEWSKV